MTRYEHIVLEDSFYSGTPSTSGGGWLGTRLRSRAANPFWSSIEQREKRWEVASPSSLMSKQVQYGAHCKLGMVESSF